MSEILNLGAHTKGVCDNLDREAPDQQDENQKILQWDGVALKPKADAFEEKKEHCKTSLNAWTA